MFLMSKTDSCVTCTKYTAAQLLHTPPIKVLQAIALQSFVKP